MTVQFWAGAKRAAGLSKDSVRAATVAELIDLLARRPRLAEVLPACSYLVDGLASGPDAILRDGAVVDVLPPFAGG